MRPVQARAGTARGNRGPLGTVLRTLAIGMGLFIWLFAMMIPVTYAFRAVPAPQRLWLITAGMAPVCLVAGGWIRRRSGPSAMRPLAAGAVVQALLLFGFRLLLDAGGETYNEVAFGWPGLLLALTMPPLGGVLAARLPARRERPLAPEGKMALAAALLWVVLEFGLRGQAALLLSRLTGSLRGGDQLAVLLGFPVCALLVVRLGARRGVGREDWVLRWNRAALAAGLAGGAAALALLPAAAWLDGRLFGQAAAELAASAGAGAAHPLWVASLMLVSNGLVTPVTEEVAWRGVIQTGLVRALGSRRGLLLTAGMFTLKHVLIDGSAARLSTLALVSLVLGLVRRHWGTGASIASHLVINLVGTALLLLAP